MLEFDQNVGLLERGRRFIMKGLGCSIRGMSVLQIEGFEFRVSWLSKCGLSYETINPKP